MAWAQLRSTCAHKTFIACELASAGRRTGRWFRIMCWKPSHGPSAKLLTRCLTGSWHWRRPTYQRRSRARRHVHPFSTPCRTALQPLGNPVRRGRRDQKVRHRVRHRVRLRVRLRVRCLVPLRSRRSRWRHRGQRVKSRLGQPAWQLGYRISPLIPRKSGGGAKCRARRDGANHAGDPDKGGGATHGSTRDT